MAVEPEILFDRRGAAGLVTLNRPQALNAVTLVMVRELRAQLDAWRDDPAVTRVIIAGAGGRAFSAGGDLRQVYELGRSGRQAEALIYWREEYALNTAIKHYPKPYIALIDGIVMGGGVGVSVHGSHRVAGERFLFAMPEVGIGFFPDVGATWFLPRMPGEVGTYCALTGERLDAADGVMTKAVTHRIASAKFAELREALCTAVPVDALLSAFAQPVQGAKMAIQHGMIDRLFKGSQVEDILAALDEATAAGGDEGAFAGICAETIRKKSPTSLKLALAQMRAGKGLSFGACMQTEFRIVSRIIRGHDFYEGVRAVIIDKAPKWRPSTLAEVSPSDVDRHFAPLAGGELDLP